MDPLIVSVQIITMALMLIHGLALWRSVHESRLSQRTSSDLPMASTREQLLERAERRRAAGWYVEILPSGDGYFAQMFRDVSGSKPDHSDGSVS